MKRRINVEEIGAVIEPVLRGDDVLIEKDGKLIAAIISAPHYEVLERRRAEARHQLLEFAQANWEKNAGVPGEEIASAVDEAVRAARRAVKGRRSQR